MEKKNVIRSFVWGLICLAAVAFAYSLGWQQGVETGQQRGFMQGEMTHAYWNNETMESEDDASPRPSPEKPQRHNASAGRDDKR